MEGEVIEVPAFALENREAVQEALALAARGETVHPELMQRANQYVSFLEKYNDALSAGLNQIAGEVNLIMADDVPSDDVLPAVHTAVSNAFGSVQNAFMPEPNESS